jgi:hypothetical protein
MTNPSPTDDDAIDFAELYSRIRRGLVATSGLALLGLAIALIVTVVVTANRTTVSTLRVTFAFPGFERGQYPNGTKFQADDIRAPDIVNEAIKRLGAQALTPDVTSKIRGAIGISGFVSPNIIKERDRLRAAGQNLPPYFPDEYEVSLSLPRNYALDVRQRELLLSEIVNVYLEKFRRNYVMLPPEFGNAFSSLRSADFVEYELVLTKELQGLSAYLGQKIDVDNEAERGTREIRIQTGAAKQFRSPTNNLSFQDLLKQTELFTQIRLNDVLSQIYVHGLSKDRNYAMVKMDYHLRTLEDQEQRLKEEETVVTGLLEKTQERAQNYVLATKTQSPQGNQPMMDQGFIDSLLANDAYNFLIRRALDAGLGVKRIQADKARLQQRRQRMESFAKEAGQDQAAAIAKTQTALAELEASYQELLNKVRTVLDDYTRQEYADAVRVSMQARTDSVYQSLAFGGLLGFGAGLALGLGLSLLGIHVGRARA